MAAKVDDLANELTCLICNELYREPKTLPCLHAFCSECLKTTVLYKMSTHHDPPTDIAEFPCPVCRSPADLSRGIDALKTDFKLKNMVEAIKNAGQCGKCDQPATDVYCLQCSVHLCGFCAEYHRRSRDFDSHQLSGSPVSSSPSSFPRTSSSHIVPADGPHQLNEYGRCRLHSTENLSMYCLSCNTLTCIACAFLNHRSCSMEYINETLMEKEKKNLLERVRAFEGSMGGITKQYCHLLEAKKSLTAKRDEIVSDIDNSHKAAAESLASNHTELHHQLSKIYDIQLSEIEGHIQVVEDFNERVSKILNLSLDELLNFTELLKVKNEVLADIKGLSCTMRQIENTTISERNDLILRVNPLPVQIGYLVKKIVTFTGNIPSLNKQGIPHSLTLQAIGEDNNNIQHGGVSIEASISHTHDDHTPLPTQVIDNDNGTYTLNYTPKYHTPIRVALPNYECKINVVRSYTPMVPVPTEYPVNAHPSGVCILPGNMIAVSLQEKIVKIYDVENQQTVTDIKSNFVRPYLMTLDKDNLWVTDREAHNIQRFSLDGFKKTLQYGSKGTTNWQFLHPRGIAVHPITGHIYVSDMRNHRISVFKVTDDTLVVVGNFGKVGDGPGQFDQPAGIMFNQYDQLVVCDDRNCRLQIFDGEGQHISTYGVSANSNKGILCSPIGVAQDNYGRYVVGEFGSHLVTVLSFEGDILSCIRSGGKGIGCLSHPRGVAIDNDGFMYVADFGNKRVVRM